MTSPVSAVEAIEKAMEGGYWAATVFDCRPPRSSRDNPLKHSRIVTVHGKFATEEEALNAGDAAIKSGWAGSCAIDRDTATHSAAFELARSSVSDLVRAVPAILTLARQAETLKRENAEVAKAVLEVLDAVRDYLPPDGISARDCLSRVISAVDNSAINPLIKKLEHINVDA